MGSIVLYDKHAAIEDQGKFSNFRMDLPRFIAVGCGAKDKVL